MREIAAGRPGLVTHVGLGTYVDPRQTGGKQNSRTTEDLVEVVTLRGREWLMFHAFPIDVAVIRGTTADEDGNITMEGEAIQAEMLDMAMAARNSGGIVIAQVRQLARRGSLPQRDVKVPGALVDYVYVDPDQWQTYITQDSPYYAGKMRKPVGRRAAAAARRAQDHRPPLAARVRAAATSATSASASRQLIGRVAWEEGITDQLVLTVEQGIFGGAPVAGNEGGAGFNYQAMIDQPYMFDFYDGGGLDVAIALVRRGRRGGQRQRPRLRGPRPGPGRLPEHQRTNAQDQLRRHAHGAGPEARDRRRACASSTEGSLPKFVPQVARDLVQRPARARARPAGALHHRSRRVRARPTRAWR